MITSVGTAFDDLVVSGTPIQPFPSGVSGAHGYSIRCDDEFAEVYIGWVSGTANEVDAEVMITNRQTAFISRDPQDLWIDVSTDAAVVIQPFSDSVELAVESIQTTVESILGRASLIEVVSPVAAGGDVDIYAGDTYSVALGTALEWSSSDWPNLATASSLDVKIGHVGFTSSMSFVSVGGVVQTVRMELTPTQSGALKRMTRYKFRIRALIGSDYVTLVDATMTIHP